MNLDNKYGRATLLRLFSIMCGEEFSMTLAEADENEKIRVQTYGTRTLTTLRTSASITSISSFFTAS
jgi:hypothetical protein